MAGIPLNFWLVKIWGIAERCLHTSCAAIVSLAFLSTTERIISLKLSISETGRPCQGQVLGHRRRVDRWQAWDDTHLQDMLTVLKLKSVEIIQYVLKIDKFVMLKQDLTPVALWVPGMKSEFCARTCAS